MSPRRFWQDFQKLLSQGSFAPESLQANGCLKVPFCDLPKAQEVHCRRTILVTPCCSPRAFGELLYGVQFLEFGASDCPSFHIFVYFPIENAQGIPSGNQLPAQRLHCRMFRNILQCNLFGLPVLVYFPMPKITSYSGYLLLQWEDHNELSFGSEVFL